MDDFTPQEIPVNQPPRTISGGDLDEIRYEAFVAGYGFTGSGGNAILNGLVTGLQLRERWANAREILPDLSADAEPISNEDLHEGMFAAFHAGYTATDEGRRDIDTSAVSESDLRQAFDRWLAQELGLTAASTQ